MRRNYHTIDIVPKHVPLGDGSVHEEYAVHCFCGYYDKTGTQPTEAARRREAMLLAMNHNSQRHGYKYEIRGGFPQ